MKRGLKRYFSKRSNTVGLIIVLTFTFIAIFAPVLSPPDPMNPGPDKRVGRSVDLEPKPPSLQAPLGTLPRQYSVYHALVWGCRQALVFGITVASITAIFGILIGLISGYSGGRIDGMLMRVTDAFLAFPVIAGIVLFQQLWVIFYSNLGALFFNGVPYINFAPTGITTLFDVVDPVSLAFIFLFWMPYARITNTVVHLVKHQEYYLAAEAVGAKPKRIIFRHLLPNSISPGLVLAARDVGALVLLQATFTFIGMGGRSIWGKLLSDGRSWVIGPGGNIFVFWWIFLPATLAIIFFGVGWNLLGDGLNDFLNPRLR